MIHYEITNYDYSILYARVKRATYRKKDYSISITRLPREIETQEIVNRIISTATSAQQALQSLDNYRLVSKAIAQYIDTHKQIIKKAIHSGFCLKILHRAHTAIAT